MQIGHSCYDNDKAKEQNHKRHCHTVSHECHNAEQIPPDHGHRGDPPFSYNGSSISGDSMVSSLYTCFTCGTDGHYLGSVHKCRL